MGNGLTSDESDRLDMPEERGAQVRWDGQVRHSLSEAQVRWVIQVTHSLRDTQGSLIFYQQGMYHM